MSNDFNKIIISGRLIKDPHKKTINTTEGTVSLLDFVIANQTFKSSETSFFNCELWGKRTDYFSDKLHKGSAVIIEGELKQQRWLDKNTSETKSKIVINVFNINIIGGDKNFQPKNQNENELKNFNQKENGFFNENNELQIPVKKKEQIDAPDFVENSLENYNEDFISGETDPFSQDYKDDSYYEDEGNNYFK